MITLDDYFGDWKEYATSEHISNAVKLLHSVNTLHDILISRGITFPYNPKTHSLISGTLYGGYRPPDCTQGAPNSAHKTGEAVDLYDPQNHIDKALMTDQELLVQLSLYIEHPDATQGWCHLSIRPPKSGKHVFYP